MADRLTLTRALEEGGIGRDAAEHIATDPRAQPAMSVTCVTRGLDAIHENVATKLDLRATEAALRTEIAALGAELRTEVTGLRTELRSKIASVRADLALVEHRLLTRLGSMVVVATGILVAIHYIH